MKIFSTCALSRRSRPFEVAHFVYHNLRNTNNDRTDVEIEMRFGREIDVGEDVKCPALPCPALPSLTGSLLTATLNATAVHHKGPSTSQTCSGIKSDFWSMPHNVDRDVTNCLATRYLWTHMTRSGYASLTTSRSIVRSVGWVQLIDSQTPSRRRMTAGSSWFLSSSFDVILFFGGISLIKKSNFEPLAYINKE